MNSFTKQLRSGSFSTEDIDTDPMTQEDATAALADPVVDEVEAAPAEVAQLDDGADALVEADADASTLENTAQILEDAVAADAEAGTEAPADVEPAAAEIADVAIESISRKYQLQRPKRLSAESFGNPAARIATYRALSQEAMEGAKELGNRALEGLKKLVEMIKEFLKGLFDKRTRLANRNKALQQKLKTVKGAPKADAKIKIGGWGAVVGDDVSEDVTAGLKELVNFVNELGAVAKLAGKNVGEIGTVAEVDVNPKRLAGMVLKYSASDNRITVTKEQTGKADAKEIAPLDAAKTKEVLNLAERGLKDLSLAEANYKELTKELDGAFGKLKALATGKEGEVSAKRGDILASYTAISKLATAIGSVALSVIGAGQTAAEKSLATFAEPAAA